LSRDQFKFRLQPMKL